MEARILFRCHNCSVCLGTRCIEELPGMGGVNQNTNFRLNCAGWNKLLNEVGEYKIKKLSNDEVLSLLRYAPVTGAVENIGWEDEESFYYKMADALYSAGIKMSIGDGCPDSKLLYGMQSIQKIQKEKDRGYRASVFLKPYPDENLYNRVAWALPIASHIGIDIDSYNIVTMRNKVSLEKKNASQIKEIMRRINVPFVLKGVFTKEDIELVKEAKPDIVYISNHGGRVETRQSSTAIMLKEAGPVLKKYCNELWVDGGIRCKKDIEVAYHYGASQVLVARPFIKSLCYKGFIDIAEFLN